MKTCTKCGETKPKSEFYKQKGSKDGTRNTCKACNKAYSAEWYGSNKVRSSVRTRERIYGLDKTNFDLMWDAQRGSCAICEEVFLTTSHSHVDHNHTTGAVRGLLCPSCNKGLGLFYDQPSRLRAAADYIEANPS